MATYNNTSPYFNTPQNNVYLEKLEIRPVPAEKDDIIYTIDKIYEGRPDLLAYDVYGDSRLWWVIVQRNLDILIDPINDFTAGTKIFMPKGSKVKSLLGIQNAGIKHFTQVCIIQCRLHVECIEL